MALVSLRGTRPSPTERVRAHRMARAGGWERLHRGVYRQGSRADDGPDLELLRILAPGAAWSHGTACALHGLTAPSPSLTACHAGPRRIYRSVRGPIAVLSVPGARLASVLALPWRGGSVRAVGLERAVLDVVDAPRHAGGYAEVAAILSRAAPGLRWNALLAELDAQPESALVQRLGFLMESLDVLLPRGRSALLARVKPGIKVHVGPRDRRGRLASRWGVVVHLPWPPGQPPAALAPESLAPESLAPPAPPPESSELDVVLL